MEDLVSWAKFHCLFIFSCRPRFVRRTPSVLASTFPMGSLDAWLAHVYEGYVVVYVSFLSYSYNAAVPMPSTGWPVPPCPQPSFPQYPALSVTPVGYAPQPLFPVQT
ncbi:uncharacterized protein LOC119980873 isoform X2 [Tripterygium wilfordii]|uniref:uncharacterized protein LOC119980873 isoform X2 n=1 Tax=Tripterygium wilfordii TaxID=458696 RepID=UPI0018F85147|nr:uncharacterized protein LOC119980873 isoform X2 [Tripterygium wilfordii]